MKRIFTILFLCFALYQVQAQTPIFEHDFTSGLAPFTAVDVDGDAAEQQRHRQRGDARGGAAALEPVERALEHVGAGRVGGLHLFREAAAVDDLDGVFLGTDAGHAPAVRRLHHPRVPDRSHLQRHASVDLS